MVNQEKTASKPSSEYPAFLLKGQLLCVVLCCSLGDQFSTFNSIYRGSPFNRFFAMSCLYVDFIALYSE